MPERAWEAHLKTSLMLVGERSSEAKGYKAERQEAGFGLSFMNQRESTG